MLKIKHSLFRLWWILLFLMHHFSFAETHPASHNLCTLLLNSDATNIIRQHTISEWISGEHPFYPALNEVLNKAKTAGIPARYQRKDGHSITDLQFNPRGNDLALATAFIAHEESLDDPIFGKFNIEFYELTKSYSVPSQETYHYLEMDFYIVEIQVETLLRIFLRPRTILQLLQDVAIENSVRIAPHLRKHLRSDFDVDPLSLIYEHKEGLHYLLTIESRGVFIQMAFESRTPHPSDASHLKSISIRRQVRTASASVTIRFEDGELAALHRLYGQYQYALRELSQPIHARVQSDL